MRKESLRIAIAQINSIVGDLDGNAAKISQYIDKAAAFGADIISFPELALTGYPPEDLLLKSKFVDDELKKIKEISRSVKNITAVIGFVDRKGRDLYNAACVIYNGRIYGAYHKTFLPNYGVFDEKRYFSPGDKPQVFRLGQIIFGVNICEDIWQEAGPTRQQAKMQAKLIININASPYYAGKIRQREAVVLSQARANRVFIAHANLIGGQDELVFDGQSMIVDDTGKLNFRAESFKEDLLIADLEIPARFSRNKKIIKLADNLPGKNKASLPRREIKTQEPIEEIYQALLLGLSDYIKKNGFQKVVIGLSGGIDSSLVAALAVDALGKENVSGVFMPSAYTSNESQVDASELAQGLGIKFITIPIDEVYKTYLTTLNPHFQGREKNITEENLQARIRGNILMALSNKFGWLVLTTGNKSEMSTGYATLYGDMAGGFAVIKDVPKMLVYELSRYRNSKSCVIPERVFTKAPTAELKPGQKDTDTLPPYETLDPILKAYIEEDKDMEKIVSLGFDREIVCQSLSMVDRSEYKRRQAPPGIKITPKAFGRDRRMPITNKYKGAKRITNNKR